MPEIDLSVLEDPAADECWTYLQRMPEGVTAVALSQMAGLAVSDAAAGLAALRDGGLAVSGDDELFTRAEEEPEALPALPGAEESLSPGSSPAVSGPAAPHEGFSGVDPSVLVAIARQERVRLRVTGWVELIEGGEFRVMDIQQVHESRMPGDGPVSS